MNISQVSKMLHVSADTLRYYEKVGLLPSVNRKESGIRDYDETDIGWIQFIKCMRSAGLPIKELVRYVELFQKGDATVHERKEILKKQKGVLERKLQEMQETLDMLNYKVENYEKIVQAETRLKKS